MSHAHRCPRCNQITLTRELHKSRRTGAERILERCTRGVVCGFYRWLAAEPGTAEIERGWKPVKDWVIGTNYGEFPE